jgi:hypothetical protein
MTSTDGEALLDRCGATPRNPPWTAGVSSEAAVERAREFESVGIGRPPVSPRGLGSIARGRNLAMTAFLQTWTDGADLNRRPGEALEHTASDLFVDRDVARGDTVFVAEVAHGGLQLIARMVVGEVLTLAQAKVRLGTDIWDATDHLIASPGTASPMVFGRRVSHENARRLRFLQKTGRKRSDGTPVFCETSLKYLQPDQLDDQTTRTVRRLTPASAELLEALI